MGHKWFRPTPRSVGSRIVFIINAELNMTSGESGDVVNKGADSFLLVPIKQAFIAAWSVVVCDNLSPY